MKKNKSTKVKEIVAYSIFGTIWVGGLVLCCLGVYAYNGPGKLAYNPIYQAQKTLSSYFNLSYTVDFRIVGAIICLISMCILIAFLYHFANRNEKNDARKSKQLEQLKQLIASEENKPQEEVVVTSNPSNEEVK